MFRLPRLKNEEKEELKLPNVEDLEDKKDKFKSHFGLERSPVQTKDIPKEELRYKKMVSIVEGKDLKREELECLVDLERLGIRNLSSLKRAIDSEDEDLKKYDVFVISKVVKRFEMMERPTPLKELEIKDTDEFYHVINSGELEIEKYSEEEVDNFILFLLEERRSKNDWKVSYKL